MAEEKIAEEYAKKKGNKKMTDKYVSCRTNCPVPVKNVMLGCSGRPLKYQKECPRVKEYMRGNKKEK